MDSHSSACEQCQVSFGSALQARRHRRLHHSGGAFAGCVACKGVFLEANLREHQGRVSSGAKYRVVRNFVERSIV